MLRVPLCFLIALSLAFTPTVFDTRHGECAFTPQPCGYADTGAQAAEDLSPDAPAKADLSGKCCHGSHLVALAKSDPARTIFDASASYPAMPSAFMKARSPLPLLEPPSQI